MINAGLTDRSRSRVLVTGANGFIGSALLAKLLQDRRTACGLVRPGRIVPAHCIEGPALGPDADWRAVLEGIDVVVHAAARVHVMHEPAASAVAAHTQINTEGTLVLARQAAAAGVKRFVFLSTVKVMGERSAHPFRADDPPQPSDAYAHSKLAAEKGLAEIGRATGMAWVIIRPPLVYGPGVGGNFAALMRWVGKGLPFPLGAIHNKRSLVSRDNLVDLITTCIEHPDAANRSFLVSDGEDLSTPELIRRLALALAVRPRLMPVPESVLMAIGRLTGHVQTIERLCGNLQVDIAETQSRLGWQPPLGVDAGLQRAAAGWRG